MKQYLTQQEQDVSNIVVERAEAWAREFMSDVLTSKDGITDDTTIQSLLTQTDGSYDDSCRSEFINNCEDKIVGKISDASFDHVSTVGELIERFIYLKFGPNEEDRIFLNTVARMNSIKWAKIEEIPDHVKDGRDVLIHYDLGNLSDVHPRVIIGWYDTKRNIWVWQGRAARAYSECYQPNYFAEINYPESEAGTDAVIEPGEVS